MKFTIESARSLKNFKTSGTIFECSPYSAKFALNKIDIKNATSIVELGCGTGVFTKEILKKKKHSSLFFGLEINTKLAAECQKRFPNAIIYNDSAEKISTYLTRYNKDKADLIISTLPWAIFKKENQEKILKEIHESLDLQGEFITIAYMLGDKTQRGKTFYKLLKKTFRSVEKTKPVIKNLPPAFFYICKK